MNDTLEWLTLDRDMLLSQASLVPRPLTPNSGVGGDLSPRPFGVSKPCAVFVDADTPIDGSLPIGSYDSTASDQSFEYSSQLNHALQYDTATDNDVQYQHMYFGQPSNGSSSCMSPEEDSVMSEFFVSSPSESSVATYTTLEVAGEELIQPHFEGDANVTNWLETNTRLPADGSPDYAQVLAEIRETAAAIDQRSAANSAHESSQSPSLSSHDDEFEAALNATSDDGQADMDYTPTLDAELKRPKRQYSKRLGRPLTKDERRERKKAQNRAAALRYRQKKVVCQSSTEVVLGQLTKRNLALRSSIKTTQAEIDIMKRLLNDVRQSLGQ